MSEKDIKKSLPGVKENILLSAHTTFEIGGPAKYFFTAKSQKDLIKAIGAAKEFNLPFFVLGGGSNLLVSDRGYKGLIIKIQSSELKIQGSNIYAEAGVPVSKIVDISSKNDLTGFEWAAGIPGTVGGAVYGNIGAFGSTMENNIKSVKALDIQKLKVKTFSNKECRFGNKDSVFKKNKNLLVLSVLLELKKGDRGEISQEIKRFLGYRKENHPLGFPSAGCIFKNHDKKITDKELLKKYPELIEFNKGSRIPTSYFIDKCGLKGKIMGRVKISEKHANFIVNLGGAKAEDVIKLVNIIKEKVKEKFKVTLEEEVQYLGF